MDGNDRADELGGVAVVGETVTVDPVIEKGCGRGDGRRCDLRGAARRIHSQLLTEAISLHTLRKTLETRSSHLRMCAACNDDFSKDK